MNKVIFDISNICVFFPLIFYSTNQKKINFQVFFLLFLSPTKQTPNHLILFPLIFF